MNDITTLFTAIGDFFTQSGWFSMVKPPFWILLFTVAVGGVYCARYGKQALFNQGIGGTLNLTFIYLVAVIACIYIPFLRKLLSQLPFLSVSDQGIFLTDPFGLTFRDLSPLLLRLFILIFLINLADFFRVPGNTLLSWLLSQLTTISIALLMYTISIALISLVFPALLGRFAVIPVSVLLAIGILMLCEKFLFTVVLRKSNSFFTSLYKFFTVNKIGSLLTISGIGFLFSIGLLCLLRINGSAVLSYTGNKAVGLWIILAMLLAVAYIFCMFYSDRKKN